MDTDRKLALETDEREVDAMRIVAENARRIEILDARGRTQVANAEDAEAALDAEPDSAYRKRTLDKWRGMAAATAMKQLAIEQETAKAQDVVNECEAIYRKAGFWNRFYLVPGGHIHQSTRCSSCYPATEFIWLWDYAAMPIPELIKLAGRNACSMCFLDAPVDVLARPSRIKAPEQRAREEKRVERARELEAKAITSPDGSVLRLGRYDRIATLHAAEQRLVGNLTDILGKDGPYMEGIRESYWEGKEQENAILLAAISHKLGKPIADILPAYEEKARKKFKRANKR